MAKKKLAERKFTKAELKQLNSRKYLSGKCVMVSLIEGNKTDFALFALNDRFVKGHHSAGVSPVVVGRANALKVVVSYVNRSVAKSFSAIGEPSVMFVTENTVGDALHIALKFAEAQNNLLWHMPTGTSRVGKKRRGTTV